MLCAFLEEKYLLKKILNIWSNELFKTCFIEYPSNTKDNTIVTSRIPFPARRHLQESYMMTQKILIYIDII